MCMIDKNKHYNNAWLDSSFPVITRCWIKYDRTSDHIGDIASVIGPKAWARLTADIRRRFAYGRRGVPRHVFKGVMTRVEGSWAGRLLAHVCRLIGTPLAPYVGSNVPCAVTVGPDTRRNGAEWLRAYEFKGRRPVRVKSAKVMDTDNKLLEFVGAGFGMRLDVYEQNHALHFVSTRYFWEGLGFRIYLPHLLSPGTAHVVHEDVGHGRFRFTITITHALLGRMFYQDGIFAEEGAR